MKRVNILFVMPQMGMGGSERLVHNLALRLDRNRFALSVAWLYGNEVLQEFKDLRVPLHYVPKTRRIDFATMRALQKIVEDNQIDVVNAQHFMPAIYSYYGCKVAAKKALIFTAHSRWEVEETPFKWRVAGGYLLRRLDTSIGVTLDVSNAIQSVFKTGAHQTVTIENGVDTDLFTPEKDAHGLSDSLGLTDRDIVIGVVANLKRVKNHLFLLQAFAKIAVELENVKLLIIGQGFAGSRDNTEPDLRLFISNNRLAGRVLFLGYRTDIRNLLHVMDVFCLTSLREGLPIGLIEAMAAGRAVVGTNVEGIRDVIEDDKDGFLVEIGDVQDLANTLLGLVKDPELRRTLGSAARRKAVERYSLKRCVEKYERLFLAAADGSRTPHSYAIR